MRPGLPGRSGTIRPRTRPVRSRKADPLLRRPSAQRRVFTRAIPVGCLVRVPCPAQTQGFRRRPWPLGHAPGPADFRAGDNTSRRRLPAPRRLSSILGQPIGQQDRHHSGGKDHDGHHIGHRALAGAAMWQGAVQRPAACRPLCCPARQIRKMSAAPTRALACRSATIVSPPAPLPFASNHTDLVVVSK